MRNASGEKISVLRDADKSAKEYLEPLRKLDAIKSREEYLEEKASLKKLSARTTILLDDAFQRFLEKPRQEIPQK